jgi:hypothetical protein
MDKKLLIVSGTVLTTSPKPAHVSVAVTWTGPTPKPAAKIGFVKR